MDARKKTKAQLLAELETLQHSAPQDMLRLVIESLDEGLLVADPRGVVRFANRPFADVWRMPEPPSPGSAMGDLAAALDPLGARAGEVRGAMLDSIPGERRQLRLHDGRVVESSMLAPPDAGVEHRVWCFRDVTERAALEERTRHSHKLEAIGRLAAGVAHEFNNILFTITSACELVRLRAAGDDTFARELSEIESAASRAASVTHRLVAFARQQVLQTESLDLNQVVLGLERMIRRFLGEHIEVSCNLAPLLDPICADRQGLEQVLLSLVANARAAMPKGGRLTIETANVVVDDEQAARLGDATPGPHVLLAVSDTGPGLDDEARSRMFEPFSAASQQRGGDAFGLAAVYGTVRQHGAHIIATSTPAQGTAFEIYFRRHAPALAVTPPAPIAHPATVRGEVVLVAEDQELPRDVACRALRAEGYQVLSAADGKEALELGRSHPGPIHLLVTDVLMPHVNGPDLFVQLAESRPGLRVMFISGHSDGIVDDEGRMLVGDDYLEKPFSIRALLERVRRVLDRG